MKISLTNFGPVRGKQNYEIDLSTPFTLITGTNGTGKTYLGYLVHGITRTLSKDIKIIPSFIKKLPSPAFVRSSSETTVYSYTKEQFSFFIETIFTHINDEIHHSIGISSIQKKEIMNEFSIISTDYTLIVNSLIGKLLRFEKLPSAVDMLLNAHKNLYSSLRPQVTEINTVNSTKNKSIEIEIPTKGKHDQYEVIKLLTNLIFKELNIRSIFFPTERNSIYTFSKELTLNRSNVIKGMHNLLQEEQMDSYAYLKKYSNRYPEVIEQSLNTAIDLEQVSKQESKYAWLAEEIESNILNGSVSLSKEGEVEFTPNGNKGLSVPIQMTASFIKTISPLVFYLRHQAQKGDLVMIDEPEMNLHPNMQIEIARILSRISNAGIKVWVSTHSDYIISELNNLITAASLWKKGKKEKVESLGYTEELLINKENIQALYMNPEKAKTQVKIENLEVTDLGVDIKSIDDCLEQLNIRSNELMGTYENIGNDMDQPIREE